MFVASIITDKKCLDEDSNSGYQIALASRKSTSPKTPILPSQIKKRYGGCSLGKKEAFRKEISVESGAVFLIGKQIALTACLCVCSGKNRKFRQGQDSTNVTHFWLLYAILTADVIMRDQASRTLAYLTLTAEPPHMGKKPERIGILCP